MITITNENDELKIVGSINLGYIGTFEDSDIEIIDTLEEVRDWEIVCENLDEESTDHELLDFLNQYFNEYIERIAKNIKRINDTFLLKVFLDMEACGAEFWNIDELVVTKNMPEDCDRIYATNWSEMSRLMQAYAETANDGSFQKEDIEALLKKFFPMFNFEAFIEGIIPEGCCLSDGSISFQCSDAFDNAILCSAYDELDENLCFTDWHNF